MAKGEHAKDKHRVQGYYLAKEKALQVMVAKHDHMTLTDSIMRNAIDRAKALNLVDENGKIREEFKDELNLEISIIEQQGGGK